MLKGPVPAEGLKNWGVQEVTKVLLKENVLLIFLPKIGDALAAPATQVPPALRALSTRTINRRHNVFSSSYSCYRLHIYCTIANIPISNYFLPHLKPSSTSQFCSKWSGALLRAVERSKNPGVPVLYGGHNLPPWLR